MMRLQLRKSPVFAFAAAMAPATAHAARSTLPHHLRIAGPLGTLELSGGADGYAYALTGAGDETNKGLLGTSTSAGVQFLNGLIQLQKPDGLLRFTVQVGAVNSLTLGTKPAPPSVQTWSTGPVRTAYVTLAPTENFTISVGQMGSVEGFELSIDWENYNLLTTALWFVAELAKRRREGHLHVVDRCPERLFLVMVSTPMCGITCSSRLRIRSTTITM